MSENILTGIAIFLTSLLLFYVFLGMFALYQDENAMVSILRQLIWLFFWYSGSR